MKKYRLLIFACLIIIIGFLVAPTQIMGRTKNIFFLTLKPLTMVSNVVIDKVAFAFKNLVHLNSLGKENSTLLKENLELQGQLSVLKEVQHENEILKKEIGFLGNKGDLKLVPSNIIDRSETGYIKTVVIDRGEKDGLRENQAVISQGFLVGTVKKVHPDSAEVTLVTDSNSLVPVVLQDSRGTGLLRGGLGGLAIEDVPLNIEIKKGEQVVTSGLGGDIPAGLMVGTAEDVVSHEGEIFQKVNVRSPIQIYFLEFVFVVVL